MLAFAALCGAAFFVLMVHDPLGDMLEMAAEEPVHELQAPETASVVPVVADEEPVTAVPHVVEPDPGPVRDVAEAVVRRGDTAAALLGQWLSSREIYDLNKASKEVYPLSRMRVGRPYRIVTVDGALTRFEYEIDSDDVLVVERGEAGYTVTSEEIVYDKQVEVVHGEITSSLFGAVAAAGEKPALAVRLSDIFAWDVDFIRDIRVGDAFTAVVEKRFREGAFAGYGRVLAAEFVNQGSPFKGFLFPDENGRDQYYDENGKSLRKAFLKAPLNFSRISSGFNLRRLHPILKVRRPHPGIDYAAPRGTPVKAVGDGVVIRKGWDRGGGNYVKIRHNSVYETTYMHLKGFARGVRKGKRVSQGDVIAYVGSTGMSTGPHLDFRMKKNGSYVNPRRIKSPSCTPVKKERMGEYMASIQPLLAQLHKAASLRAEAPADAEGSASGAAL